MITLRRGDPAAQGTWWREYARPNIWVTFRCQDCGAKVMVSNSDIGDDGMVKASAVCTDVARTKPNGCVARAAVRLSGWST